MAADKPDVPRRPATWQSRRRRCCWPRSSGSRPTLRRAERKIAELEARADVDPLLDILNRRGFERELKRSLAYVQRYGTEAALLFIDLDGFKAVNDRHGHAAGDALLKAVARRARRPCARLRRGGAARRRRIRRADVESRARPQAVAKARELEKLIDAISVAHGEARLSVGASAGIAPLRPDATRRRCSMPPTRRCMRGRRRGSNAIARAP